MKSALPIDRFQSLLAAYGGRLELFPAAEREAAQALLASSAEARALLSAEAGLDALLGRAAPSELSPAFSRKLAELPVRHPQARSLMPMFQGSARWNRLYCRVEPSQLWSMASPVRTLTP